MKKLTYQMTARAIYYSVIAFLFLNIVAGAVLFSPGGLPTLVEDKVLLQIVTVLIEIAFVIASYRYGCKWNRK